MYSRESEPATTTKMLIINGRKSAARLILFFGNAPVMNSIYKNSAKITKSKLERKPICRILFSNSGVVSRRFTV